MKRVLSCIILLVSISYATSMNILKIVTKYDGVNVKTDQKLAPNHVSVRTEMQGQGPSKPVATTLRYGRKLGLGRMFGDSTTQSLLMPSMLMSGMLGTVLINLVGMSLTALLVGSILLFMRVNSALTQSNSQLSMSLQPTSPQNSSPPWMTPLWSPSMSPLSSSSSSPSSSSTSSMSSTFRPGFSPSFSPSLSTSFSPSWSFNNSSSSSSSQGQNQTQSQNQTRIQNQSQRLNQNQNQDQNQNQNQNTVSYPSLPQQVIHIHVHIDKNGDVNSSNGRHVSIFPDIDILRIEILLFPPTFQQPVLSDIDIEQTDIELFSHSQRTWKESFFK